MDETGETDEHGYAFLVSILKLRLVQIRGSVILSPVDLVPIPIHRDRNAFQDALRPVFHETQERLKLRSHAERLCENKERSFIISDEKQNETGSR